MLLCYALLHLEVFLVNLELSKASKPTQTDKFPPFPGKGFECRCGASRGNAAAWNRRPPLEGLLVPWDKKLNSSKDGSLKSGEINHQVHTKEHVVERTLLL